MMRAGMLSICFMALLCAVLPTLAAPAVPAGWQIVSSTSSASPGTLRAFGRVKLDRSTIADKRGARVNCTRFLCSDSEKAAVLAGKFLSDLCLSFGVNTEKVQIGADMIPVWRTASDAGFVVCLEGSETRILSADRMVTLLAFAKAQPDWVSGAVESASYPMYLDKFDRWGWAFGGVGGLENYHGWMGKGGQKDPLEDMDFMGQYGFRSEVWLMPAGFDNSDGLNRDTEAKWKSHEAAKRGLPISYYMYTNAGGADWTSRKLAQYMEQPADFIMSGWHGPTQHWKAQPHLSWAAQDLQRYIGAKTMSVMRQYVDEPNGLGWMHPHSELQHDDWYNMHADYSPTAQRSWRAYLQNHDVDLATVTRMFRAEAQPFTDWDLVPIPEFATFSGLPGRVLDLGGTWMCRQENSGEKAAAAEWWQLPEAARYQGMKEQWWNAPLDAQWTAIHMPGSEEIYGVLPVDSRHEATTWFRRTFVLTPAQRGQGKVYLYWYPMSRDYVHSGDHPRYHAVYLNGRKAGDIGSWGALDVTDILRIGENALALHLMGGVWNGRIFLSTEPPRVYPYLGQEQNRLWLLWKDWLIDNKYRAYATVLDAMRQVDPNRPIKIPAPINMTADRYLDLCVRYGAFPHFTGEGMWFFPWYKRYAYLYDVPGSSELAGPSGNVNHAFDSLRRTFLAGLNGHESVFFAQTYTRNPDLRAWWAAHNTLVKRMGKYDIDGPQVLLYRNDIQTTNLAMTPCYPKLGIASREIQNAWYWDLGRGSLQTIGQSYLYLDDGGIAAGKMNGYTVMIDSGNEMMSPQTIARIAEWVKTGGTFVTLPFTGRNSFIEADSWPITALTGCKVSRLREPGTGTITFAINQRIFQQLAGRSFPDAGRAEYLKINHNQLSTELQPGQDCEVLATFENGAPAIVKRKLGKGSVIALGTAYWRDCYDGMGIWWPGQRETDFLADLLTGLNFPAATCTTNDPLVWAQPFRSNNGLESVSVLVNWHNDEDTTVDVTLRLPAKPAALVSYGVDGMQALPFAWKDGIATLKVAMPAKEVKVLSAQVYAPESAIAHWWQYQERMWHPLDTPQIDFTPYTKGKWADATLDLIGPAKFTNSLETSTAWTQPAYDDAKWNACRVGVLNFDGAEPAKPAQLRKAFQVPREWSAGGGEIYLVSAAWSGPHYHGKARLYLNGVMLHDFTENTYNEYPVSRLLQPGNNVVAIEFQGGLRYVGLSGNLYLYHAAMPERSVELPGFWTGKGLDGKVTTLYLPGKGRMKQPTREVSIPAEWRGRYRVRLNMEGDRYSLLGVWVNGKMVRRHHHLFGTRCDIDITQHLKFGEANTLILAATSEGNGMDLNPANVPTWDIRSIQLDLYPVED